MWSLFSSSFYVPEIPQLKTGWTNSNFSCEIWNIFRKLLLVLEIVCGCFLKFRTYHIVLNSFSCCFLPVDIRFLMDAVFQHFLLGMDTHLSGLEDHSVIFHTYALLLQAVTCKSGPLLISFPGLLIFISIEEKHTSIIYSKHVKFLSGEFIHLKIYIFNKFSNRILQ